MGYYWPEGMLLETEENRYYLQNEETLQSAMRIGQILEGRALLCDYDHNLVVDMGCCRGIIPREEGALGIKEQTVRDIAIISRVNKSVCFLITAIERQTGPEHRGPFYRRRCSPAALPFRIHRPSDPWGDHPRAGNAPGKLRLLCGYRLRACPPSSASIRSSISRISHPRDRFAVGESIYAVVKAGGARRAGCSFLHKELLGTWAQNAELYLPGETVAGIIRSGGGLWRLCGADPQPGRPGGALRGRACAGQHAGVYIKSLLPEKMKVEAHHRGCL